MQHNDYLPAQIVGDTAENGLNFANNFASTFDKLHEEKVDETYIQHLEALDTRLDKVACRDGCGSRSCS